MDSNNIDMFSFYIYTTVQKFGSVRFLFIFKEIYLF